MDGNSLDIKSNILEKLKAIIPGAFIDDNLDFDRLKLMVGALTDSNSKESYSLSWVGKSAAYTSLQETTSSTLTPVVNNSISWDTSRNIFVEGENLEVLKVLQRSYYGKIKMIYIDPPYNTGSDSFVYPDKFSQRKTDYFSRAGLADVEGHILHSNFFRPNSRENGHFHSNWLSMMLPRLYLAANLLRDDGVIFVSIDDNEVYSLKLLMDEIFGENNFVGNIIWNSTKSVTNTALLSVSHTHNLVYFKNLDYHKKNRYDFRLPDTIDGFSNPDNDPRGPWKADPFQVGGIRPNQLYEITNPSTGQIYVPNPGCSWKNDFSRFQELLSDNRIVFGSSGEAGPQRKRFWYEAQERGRVAKSLWSDLPTTSNATIDLQDLIGVKVFNNPKPVDLIRRFVQLGTAKDDDIVLDFFGGSGTTAEAVVRQNIEDGVNRSFIFITFPEPVDSKTPEGSNALSIGCTNLADVARYRISKAFEKISHEIVSSPTLFPHSNSNILDLGFRYFNCTASHFPKWRGDLIKNLDDLNEALDLFENTNNTPIFLNLLFEIMLKVGINISCKYSELLIDECLFFHVSSHNLVLAFSDLNLSMARQLLSLNVKTVFFLDTIFNDRDEDKLNLSLFFRNANVDFKSI